MCTDRTTRCLLASLFVGAVTMLWHLTRDSIIPRQCVQDDNGQWHHIQCTLGTSLLRDFRIFVPQSSKCKSMMVLCAQSETNRCVANRWFEPDCLSELVTLALHSHALLAFAEPQRWREHSSGSGSDIEAQAWLGHADDRRYFNLLFKTCFALLDCGDDDDDDDDERPTIRLCFFDANAATDLASAMPQVDHVYRFAAPTWTPPLFVPSHLRAAFHTDADHVRSSATSSALVARDRIRREPRHCLQSTRLSFIFS
jgi:hypothetical protein